MMLINSMANQGSIYHWSRDHRVHHKYSEQDADPHNATRGFFFAHMGWLYVKKHPEVGTVSRLCVLEYMAVRISWVKKGYISHCVRVVLMLSTRFAIRINSKNQGRRREEPRNHEASRKLESKKCQPSPRRTKQIKRGTDRSTTEKWKHTTVVSQRFLFSFLHLLCRSIGR